MEGPAPSPQNYQIRLAAPQILRGIAAIWVVIFHVHVLSKRYVGYELDSSVVRAGHIGVDFFFVLSGFIIYLVHARDIGKPSTARTYFLKRFARIYPLVFIANTIKLDFVAFGGKGVSAEKLSLSSVVGSYLLLPDTNPWLHDVTWTLAYEMWFYVLFGVLLLFGQRTMTLAGIVYAACIVTLQLPGCPSLSGLPGFIFSTRILEFMVGIAVATLMLHGVRIPLKVAGICAPLALALIIAACVVRWDSRLGSLAHAMFWGPAFALLLFFLLQIEMRISFASLKPLLFAGDASYSIYLFHSMPLNVMFIFFRNRLAAGEIDKTLACLIFALLAVGSSMVFYVAVETPIQNYFRAKLRRTAAG